MSQPLVISIDEPVLTGSCVILDRMMLACSWVSWILGAKYQSVHHINPSEHASRISR